MVAEVIGQILIRLRHEICGVATTESGAVDAAARCKPDMMIVDLALGAGDGASAVATILRTGPIPYVMMSGALLRSDGVMLRKPFREADLLLAMERALESNSPNPANDGVSGP